MLCVNEPCSGLAPDALLCPYFPRAGTAHVLLNAVLLSVIVMSIALKYRIVRDFCRLYDDELIKPGGFLPIPGLCTGEYRRL